MQTTPVSLLYQACPFNGSRYFVHFIFESVPYKIFVVTQTIPEIFDRECLGNSPCSPHPLIIIRFLKIWFQEIQDLDKVD